MSVLGNRVLRTEDPRFLTGRATYVDDVVLPGAAHAAFVRSEVAHGVVRAIDAAAAAAMPGVLAVFTAADLGPTGVLGTVRITAPSPVPKTPEALERPLLAGDRVRYVGEPVAVVVAATRAQAADGAGAVVVAYEGRPAVVDPRDGATDAVLLFPEHGTNIVGRGKSRQSADFSECAVVVELDLDVVRMSGAPIEGRAGAASWGDDSRLTHWTSNQGAHPTRDLLCAVYGLEPGAVRVVVPDVGGGFGVKSRTYPDELLLGALARAVGRPVRWAETRTEHLLANPQGRGQHQRVRIGGTRAGRITAYELTVVQDAGAYPLMGALLPMMTQRMLTGVYALDNVGFSSVSVATNKVSTTAFRGAGRPEATVAIERAIDAFAAAIGLDPAEVRRRNLVPRFTQGYTTGIGTVYDVGDYPAALERALAAAGYEELRAEQARRRTQPEDAAGRPLLGIGLGAYVEITAGGPGSEHATVALAPDGRVTVVTGATPSGQGHDTTWAMIVGGRTGLAIEEVGVVHGDTDRVPRGGLTVGSRSVQIAGATLDEATADLVVQARAAAARLLEADAADIVLDPSGGGRFHVAGTPAVALTWADVAASLDEPLTGRSEFQASQPTFPFGVHCAVVEVDAETGRTTLRRLVGVDDAGRIVNPVLAEGQVHGGMAQGAAEVLLEAIEYDADGTPRTTNFADYPVIGAYELPSFEVHHLETPTFVNPLGAKGVGESGTIGALPAVYNAVVDAVSHLGVRQLPLPCTPQAVWRAVQAAQAAAATAADPPAPIPTPS